MFGLSNIKFNSRNVSGAPFPGNAAFNGTSVNLTSGQIQLGDDFGSTNGQLIENRYIKLNTFNLLFQNQAPLANWGYLSNSTRVDHVYQETTNALPAVTVVRRPQTIYLTPSAGAGVEVGVTVGQNNANASSWYYRNAPLISGPQGTILEGFGTRPNVNLVTSGSIMFYLGGFPLPYFNMDSSGNLNLRTLAAATAGGQVMVRSGAGDVRGITGFTGTILPTFTNITVQDGIITAVA